METEDYEHTRPSYAKGGPGIFMSLGAVFAGIGASILAGFGGMLLVLGIFFWVAGLLDGMTILLRRREA